MTWVLGLGRRADKGENWETVGYACFDRTSPLHLVVLLQTYTWKEMADGPSSPLSANAKGLKEGACLRLRCVYCRLVTTRRREYFSIFNFSLWAKVGLGSVRRVSGSLRLLAKVVESCRWVTALNSLER